MTASELNRNLLFHGYDEVTDYLKNSPLNRYLYKRILGILSARGIEVPIVKLFNEIYYQCVRVNYDATPGSDIERRYWLEEEVQLRSSEGAQLVFCVVWSLLNVKRNLTFHEECFLRGLVSFIRNSALRSLAEELPGELLSNNLSVPERFPVMTCPISMVDMLWDKSLISKDYFENSKRYRDLIATKEREYHEAWKEVTGGYSSSAIGKYVQLYSGQEEQLKLISYMKTGLTDVEYKKNSSFFKDLELQIKTGSFDMSEALSIPSASLSDPDTEWEETCRIHYPLEDADGDSSLNLIKQYKQECETLKLEREEVRRSHAMELARIEAKYQAEIERLQQENNRFLRWPSKKRVGELKPSEWSSDIPVFNINEMSDYMKERFSKSSAEEVCAMLYHLVVKHGNLSEETLKLIDSIVPAILKRNKLQQIFNLHHVSQFNNNPGTVVNS